MSWNRNLPKRRKLFPRIIFVTEMPDEILSSPTAAYHPWSQTILIIRGLPWWLSIVLFLHEFGHHWISIFLNQNSYLESIHEHWDNVLKNEWICQKIEQTLLETKLWVRIKQSAFKKLSPQ